VTSMAGIGDTLRGKTVLVTGGSGFIGCRLVERLIERHGARVRVLVRDVSRAARVATFPVDIARGSVLDTAAVHQAARDCDVVFHCAYGTAGAQGERARTNFDGTRIVFEAALAAGVRRVVDLSTLMVYGATDDGDLDESSPRRRLGDAYADSKRRAEGLALDWARKRALPVVVLQPTAVYGPYGGVWTETPLRQLQSGRMPLIDGGEGVANAVYVDDLVSAMLLAATRDGVVGEAFLVSGPESESWRAFYSRFEAMLDGPPGGRLQAQTAAEARAAWRRRFRRAPSLVAVLASRWAGDGELRTAVLASRELERARAWASALPEWAQAFLKARARAFRDSRQARRQESGRAAPDSAARDAGVMPVHVLPPKAVEFFAARTRVRIDKARRLLGYEPAFSLDRGMRLTEAWARWAGVVPPARRD
jgi:nucleoside-diphosphate-sugar epimerase